MAVDVVVQNRQKSHEYVYEKKNMYVVTPRCAAAAAVVSAVVLGRPTKQYTHPYSIMHRRLPTAGIEVAPHYHQLLVTTRQFEGYATKFATTCCGPFVTVSPAHEALKDDQNVAC